MISLINVIIEDFSICKNSIILDSQLVIDDKLHPLDIFKNIIDDGLNIDECIVEKGSIPTAFIMNINCIDGNYKQKGSHIIIGSINKNNEIYLLYKYGGKI